MAQQKQYRRGTSAQHSSFTGAAGEATIDTDVNRWVIHDAATAGGIPQAKLSEVDAILNSARIELMALRALNSPSIITGYASVIGKHVIWVPAIAMEPRVTTAPAASNAVEIGTSLIALRTMDYATDADDNAGVAIYMPPSWDAGTITASFVWSTTGAQTGGLDGVRWFIQGGSYASNAVLTTALGTAVGATAQDHSATANDIMVTAETASVTIANAAASRWTYYNVYRDVSDAGDDLDIDARLHGFFIFMTINQPTDG